MKSNEELGNSIRGFIGYCQDPHRVTSNKACIKCRVANIQVQDKTNASYIALLRNIADNPDCGLPRSWPEDIAEDELRYLLRTAAWTL